MRLVLLLALSFACKRPVTGADSGQTLIFDLEADPQFIRAGVPIDLRYRVSGALPKKVTYDLAGQQFDCTPHIGGDGRSVCTHPGVNRNDYAQGTSLVVVEATDDDGKTSIATTQVTIDYDCPAFASLVVTPAIAQANKTPPQTVVLTIEATERLREAPIVTRGGINWETPVGDGSSYSVTHTVSLADPASISDVVVRITDLAGNTSLDCGVDGRISFGVDHSVPGIDPQKVLITRAEPGAPAMIEAEAGAFFDDVQVAEVRILDVESQLVAAIRPEPDGSISPHSLGGPTPSRVLVEVVDLLDQASARVSVPERWRLSVGTGATPNAAVRTGVRLSPPGANTPFLSNRTAVFAPNVRDPDARNASVRAQIGFQEVGSLPGRYEDANNIIGGYDEVGHSILAIGGHRGRDFNLYATYMSDVLLIRWDEDEGRYVHEAGPALTLEDDEIPNPRYGINIAFDGRGCGVMHGGRGLGLQDPTDPFSLELFFSFGTFELCYQPESDSYRWSTIDPVLAPGDALSGRVAPITHDPLADRYVIVGDIPQGDNDRVRFLLPPKPGDTRWEMLNVNPLPTNFNYRSRHYLFFDPRIGGITLGSGGVSPIGNGEQNIMWTYLNGQWLANEIADYMDFRSRFGFDYDRARDQLVIWGGNDFSSSSEADSEVFLMTKTATNGPGAWRMADLDAPVPRDYPTLVYDRDREVTVVFGGIRFNDTRWIEPEIHQIVMEPSYPYLQASIDLDTERPKGIERLELSVGATGLGDADGTRPRTELAGGVVVMLWDIEDRAWVAFDDADPSTPSIVDIVVAANPERFVQPEGVVTMTVRSRYPATEALDAALEVDVVDGALYLRSGVSLP